MVNQPEDEMVVELPRELTIAKAAEIKALLLSALDGNGDLELSARAVEEVDVAGLQLLWAARRSALQRNLGFAISPGSRSAALTRAIAASGLGREDGGWLGEEGGRCRGAS